MKVRYLLILLLCIISLASCRSPNNTIMYTQQLDVPLNDNRFLSILLPNNIVLLSSDLNNFWIYDAVIVTKSFDVDKMGTEVVPGVYYNKSMDSISMNLIDAAITIKNNNTSCNITDYVVCLRDSVVREKTVDLSQLTKLAAFPEYNNDLDTSILTTNYMERNGVTMFVNEESFVEHWDAPMTDTIKEHVCAIATCNNSIPIEFYEDDTKFLLICDKCVIGYKIVDDYCLQAFASIDYADYVYKMLAT